MLNQTVHKPLACRYHDHGILVNIVGNRQTKTDCPVTISPSTTGPHTSRKEGLATYYIIQLGGSQSGVLERECCRVQLVHSCKYWKDGPYNMVDRGLANYKCLTAVSAALSNSRYRQVAALRIRSAGLYWRGHSRPGMPRCKAPSKPEPLAYVDHFECFVRERGYPDLDYMTRCVVSSALEDRLRSLLQ